jgi:hypothetical protein
MLQAVRCSLVAHLPLTQEALPALVERLRDVEPQVTRSGSSQQPVPWGHAHISHSIVFGLAASMDWSCGRRYQVDN